MGKITGEEWITQEWVTKEVKTKNTFKQTIRRETDRYYNLDCGHSLRAVDLQSQGIGGSTTCHECKYVDINRKLYN